MSTIIDPADLRITFLEMPEAIVDEQIGMDGEMHTMVYRDLMRVEWDSPRGPFSRISVVSAPCDEYDEMRPYLAEMIADAYDDHAG